MDRTVREIADELGVSRQRIYRYIQTNNLRRHYRGNGRTMYFGDAEVEKMRRAFDAEEPAADEKEQASFRAAAAPDDDKKDIDKNNGKNETGSEVSGLRARVAELERENRFLKAESDYRLRRVQELTDQRGELLTALKTTTESVYRLSGSVRNLTENLRASQLMHAETMKTLQTERARRRLPRENQRRGRKSARDKASRMSLTDLVLRLLKRN